MAQGSIIAGGVAAQGDAARVVEGVPTTGSIPVGARVEREVEFDFAGIDDIRIALRNADFTTATRVEDAINRDFNRQLAVTLDSGTVVVNFRGLGDVNPARVVGRIENLLIEPEDRAKVVIDHKSGTIVVGERVRISRVAVSQGNLTLRVAEAPLVSQPNPFAAGETVTVPRTAVDVNQEPGIGFVEVAGETNLSDLVDGLNALGCGPRHDRHPEVDPFGRCPARGPDRRIAIRRAGRRSAPTAQGPPSRAASADKIRHAAWPSWPAARCCPASGPDAPASRGCRTEDPGATGWRGWPAASRRTARPSASRSRAASAGKVSLRPTSDRACWRYSNPGSGSWISVAPWPALT